MNGQPSRTAKSRLQVLYHFLLLVLFVGFLTGCQSRRVIVNGLDEKDANEILVFLSNKGIDASKVQAVAASGGGSKVVLWNISVEETQANEAMALLNQVGLPRRSSQSLLSLFSNVGLVPTGMQDKIRFQEGLAEQIANTIRKIDGVLDAEVRISFPEEDPLNPNAPKQKITASVFVKHNGVLDDPNSHLQTRIRRLVASSVNGLEYDNVTVVGDRAKYGDSASGFQTSIGEDDQQLVTVWALTVSQDSLFRFRSIFFTFILLILLFTLSLAFFLWKFAPIIKKTKSLQKLMSFHQVQLHELVELPLAAQKNSEEKEKSEEDDEEEDEDQDEDENESDDEETDTTKK